MKKIVHSLLFRELFFFVVGCFFIVFSLEKWAWSYSELDRKFQLKSIAILRPADNIDGIFSRFIYPIYLDYFSHQSRFLVVGLSQVEEVIERFSLPYSKVMEDLEILAQITRSTKSESLLRTRIIKKKSKYEVILDWFHAPSMDLIARHTFFIEDPPLGESLEFEKVKKSFYEHFPLLISQVPFLGQVLGRENETIVLDMGLDAGLKKGDLVAIGTLESISIHPYLKEVKMWDLLSIGEVRVEAVEDQLSFCKVVSEKLETKISQYQKIKSIHSKMVEQVASAALSRLSESHSEDKKKDFVPKYGWISGGFFLGNFGSQYDSGPVSTIGSGVPLGGSIQTEFWLTKFWFLNGDLRYSFWNFSQKNAFTGINTLISQNGSVGGSAISTRLNVGYSYLFSDLVMGSRLLAKLGYKTLSYQMPNQENPEFRGSRSLGSLFLGLGGDFLFEKSWGVLVDLSFGVFNYSQQTGFLESFSSTRWMGFSLGGSYFFNQRIKGKLDLNIESFSLFSDLGAQLNQKMVTFGPSLVYYF